MTTLLVALVLFAVLFAWLNRAYHATEYLFFARYPVGIAVLLFLLPFFGPSLAPSSLTNLFVMSPLEIGIVAFLALQLAWASVHAARLIVLTVPARCSLPLKVDAPLQPTNCFPEPMTLGWQVAALVLALPLTIGSVFRVASPDHAFWAAVGATAGLIAGGCVLRAGQHLAVLLTPVLGSAALRVVHRKTGPTNQRSFNPYRDLSREAVAHHARALITTVLVVLIYDLVGWLTAPGCCLHEIVPALGHLLLLATAANWFLSGIAFLADRARVPGIAFLLVLAMLTQAAGGADHYFQVLARTTPLPPSAEALQKRWQHSQGAPMIAVAASGGGITASLWTATVLQGLGEAMPTFHDEICLLSSVSGGGVGGMYYVDSFREEAAPSAATMQRVVARAGAPSLAAVAWGMAHKDTMRFDLMHDRGWALEERWRLLMDGQPATFSSWSEGVQHGWRPLQVFNATLQETGKRLLLTSVDLGARDDRSAQWVREDLQHFLPAGDLAVVTAARLSATFPFVTPMARPASGTNDDDALHCADGGYFDNSGLRSAIEVIDDYLDARVVGPRPTCVALIEIRASGQIDSSANGQTRRGGLANAFVGPLETLYQVRGTSQLLRSSLELQEAKRRWQQDHNVRLERFLFHLTDRLPLSWHLTADERAHVAAHWPTRPMPPDMTSDRELAEARKHNAVELERLRSFRRNCGGELPSPPPDPLFVQQLRYDAQRQRK